jgi:hypothetical protein
MPRLLCSPSTCLKQHSLPLQAGLPWPAPRAPEPDFITLAQFLFEAVAETTDGCLVEPDGICRHGHPSWLLRLSVI